MSDITRVDRLSEGGLPAPSDGQAARRSRLVLLAGSALALACSATPAMAGCNSGSSPAANLLTSANCQANAVDVEDTALGFAAFAGGAATALGNGAKARGELSSAIGLRPEANGREATAIGFLARALGDYATALGGRSGPASAVTGATALGRLAGSLGAGIWSTAIGAGPGSFGAANALGPYSIAIGGGNVTANSGALARHTYGIAIGTGAVASGVRSTSVGTFAGSGSTAAANNRNAFFGEGAGQLVTGGGNTASGVLSGYTVQGGLNSAFGNSSGQFVTGSNNLALGILAGHSATGDANVAIGRDAGKNIGASNTVAIGTDALASRDLTVAVGKGARALRSRAVAIGDGSVADVVGTVSVGKAGDERRIMNVAAAVSPTDAVNLAQVQAMLAGFASSASEAAAALKRPGAVGPASAIRDAAVMQAARRGPTRAPGGTAGGAPAVNVEVPTDSEELAPSTIVGWANFNPDGTLSGQRNVARRIRYGAGAYEVVFKKKTLRDCTYNATPVSLVDIAVRPGARANSLRVEIRNSNGLAADAAFSLVAIC